MTVTLNDDDDDVVVVVLIVVAAAAADDDDDERWCRKITAGDMHTSRTIFRPGQRPWRYDDDAYNDDDEYE